MAETKKIVVTGGAGYIGWHLTGMLLERGYQVVVLDNCLFGESGLQGRSDHSNFTFIHGDVLNVGDLAKSFKDAHAVIHLAAVVGDPACEKNPEFSRLVNIESTKMVVELANHYGVNRLLFASSCSVYGKSPSHVLLNEGSYLNPVSGYAESRIVSEHIILSKCEHASPTILRLSTVFGYSKRMRFDLAVNIMTMKSVTEGKLSVFGGKQYRPFVHCRDAARAFVTALEGPREVVHREVFNVGRNDNNFEILQLGQLIGSTLGVEVHSAPEREDDRSYRVDFAKIKWLLDFEPQVTIPESVLEIKQAFEKDEFPDPTEDKYYNVRYDYML